MRLLICGDRKWAKPKMIQTIIDGFYSNYGDDLVIIEGCAKGADNAACIHRPEITHEHYPAQWDVYGKRAGPVRNRQMLLQGKPELVMAFHCDLENSKGTKDMVTISEAAEIPVYLVSKL